MSAQQQRDDTHVGGGEERKERRQGGGGQEGRFPLLRGRGRLVAPMCIVRVWSTRLRICRAQETNSFKRSPPTHTHTHKAKQHYEHTNKPLSNVTHTQTYFPYTPNTHNPQSKHSHYTHSHTHPSPSPSSSSPERQHQSACVTEAHLRVRHFLWSNRGRGQRAGGGAWRSPRVRRLAGGRRRTLQVLQVSRQVCLGGRG